MRCGTEYNKVLNFRSTTSVYGVCKEDIFFCGGNEEPLFFRCGV